MPPLFTTASAVPCEFDQVSHTQCSVFGVQALSVRAEVPAVVAIMTLFFSFTSPARPSAMPEVGMSTTMSTFSVSNQRRAIAVEMSGLFCASAETSSTASFLDVALKSSTASFAASSEPWPPKSEYGPDMSLSTPILTGVCAKAAPAQTDMTPASSAVLYECFISFLLEYGACRSRGPARPRACASTLRVIPAPSGAAVRVS